MANKPPTTNTARWIYRGIFIVVGLLLIGTTCWQGVRNSEAQTKANAEARKEQQQMESKYDQLQGQLKNINDFIAHPPPGLTQSQLTEAVRTMAGKIQPPCVEDKEHPYKCKTNAELGQWIMDESSKVSDMANKTISTIYAIRKQPKTDPEDEGRFASDIRTQEAWFSGDFERCCLDNIKNMRIAALDRLGPSGEDQQEQTSWQLLIAMYPRQNVDVFRARDYVPYLSRMGMQLRSKPR